MNYNKFSKEAFELLSEDKVATKSLLQNLDKEVANELHELVASKMQEIANQLNSNGHSLKRNIDLEDAGSTDFCETHEADNCGFRLGSDVTISSGYYGESDCNEFNE